MVCVCVYVCVREIHMSIHNIYYFNIVIFSFHEGFFLLSLCGRGDEKKKKERERENVCMCNVCVSMCIHV